MSTDELPDRREDRPDCLVSGQLLGARSTASSTSRKVLIRIPYHGITVQIL